MSDIVQQGNRYFFIRTTLIFREKSRLKHVFPHTQSFSQIRLVTTPLDYFVNQRNDIISFRLHFIKLKFKLFFKIKVMKEMTFSFLLFIIHLYSLNSGFSRIYYYY